MAEGAVRLRRVMATVVVGTLILLGNVGAVAQPRERAPFDEVPARSWSYAVVDYFAARGWVSHYPGSLYTSHRTVTRYEMALAARDIVQRAGGYAGWTLSAQETLWLQLLVKEYADELELLGYRLEPLETSSSRRPGALGILAAVPAELTPRTVREGVGDGWSLESWGGGAEKSFSRGAGPWVVAARGSALGARIAAGGRQGQEMRLGSGWPPGEHRIVASASDGAQGQWTWNGKVSGSPRGPEGEREWPVLAQGERPGSPSRGDVLIGARAMFRVVERASAPWMRPGFPSPNRLGDDDRDLRSYDLVLGDMRLTPLWSDLRRGLEPWQERTAVGPVVFTSGVTSIRPRVQGGSWDLQDELKDVGTTIASVAGVGMDVVIPSARLRLGWRYEGELGNGLTWGNGTTVAGMEYQIDSRAQALAGFVLSEEGEGRTRTTQLGLRYSLGRDASLLLGYRLIDFDLRDEKRDETLSKMATAEFSTRF